MRINIKIHIAFLLLCFSGAGCKKFLEVGTPKSKIEGEIVFSSDVTATSAILGIYGDLIVTDRFANGGPYSISTLAGLSSDELTNSMQSDLPSLEFERNSLQPQNSYLLTIWTSLYKSIYQANAALEGLEASFAVTEATKNQLKGEALFIRAFCNLYLVNSFGAVPLSLTTDYNINSKLSKASKEQVYDQIEKDLIVAVSVLNSAYVSPQGERIRANKFAALSLLSRVYLYRQKWNEAELKATEVINNIGLYSLKDSLNEVFLKNSSEAIWQLQPVLTDGKGLTTEGNYFSFTNTIYYNILNKNIIPMFEPNDLRKSKWIGVIADTIFFPHKYKQDYVAEPTEYSMVIRLAEMYLVRAEARAMQNNLTGDNSAAADINKIRNRAGLESTISATQETLLDDVMRERQLELLSEWGHRWFDLKRSNRTSAVLAPAKGQYWQATDTLYPIPQLELDKNPFLKPQNEGYN